MKISEVSKHIRCLKRDSDYTNLYKHHHLSTFPHSTLTNRLISQQLKNLLHEFWWILGKDRWIYRSVRPAFIMEGSVRMGRHWKWVKHSLCEHGSFAMFNMESKNVDNKTANWRDLW